MDDVAAAATSVEAIFRSYHLCGAVSVDFAPREKVGVACDRHFRMQIRNGVKHLTIPIGLVAGTFSNSIDSFRAIATLCETYPMRWVTSGETVIDIEDASDLGDYPRIAFGSTLPNASLVVDSYYVKHRGYSILQKEIADAWVPWADRTAEVFWRGSTTGSQRPAPSPDAWHWRWLPRLNLCDVASRSHLADRLDFGITGIVHIDNTPLRERVKTSGFMRPRVSRLDFMNYRYIVDIDGNGNAWDGLFSAMLMGACILKITSPRGWRQWYYDRLIPGVHFLPVKSDLSDLNSTVAWALDHPAECAEIGRRVRQFAASMVYEDEIDLSGVKLARMLRGQ